MIDATNPSTGLRAGIAGMYEYQAGAVTKYYEGGAICRTGYASGNGITYALSDHLHSTSVLVNQNGTLNTNQYYYPYGGNRDGAFSGLTTKRFTGQYHEQGLPGGEGLYYYNARWYDAQLGRFAQADSIVPNPGNPQSLNRYSYVLGNPLRYQDPTGHAECIDDLCALVSHPRTGRPILRGGLPRAISYIYKEMTRNAQSGVAGTIAEQNAASTAAEPGSQEQGMHKLLALMAWGAQVADARVKDAVGPGLAPYLGNWDHKPIMMGQRGPSPVPEIPKERRGKPQGWSTVGSRLYRYDTWSNLHYGYVGGVSGFTEAELIQGAGLEQIGSDLFSRVRPRRSPETSDFMASWDDASDTAAIQVGYRLWAQYGLTVRPADVYLAVFENPHLATQPLGGAQ